MIIQELLAECGVVCDIEEVLAGKKHQLACPVAEWTHEKGFDSHPSAVIAVNKDTGELYFHCFTCKTSGTLGDLVFDYADYTKNAKLKHESLRSFPELNKPYLLKLAKVKARLLEASLPPIVEEEQDHSKAFNTQCLIIKSKSRSAKYLKSRNVDGSTCRSYELRYDKERKRIVLPVYSNTGKLVTAVGRALHSDDLPKYYNYYTAPTGSVLGGSQLFDDHRQIVLVEGFFDMLNLYRHSNHILPMCCFGARLTDEQALLISNLYHRKTKLPRFTITLMYDGDAPGQKATGQAAYKLRKQHIPASAIHVVWLKSGEDPGGLKEADYLYYLENAKKWQPARKRSGQKTASSLKQLLSQLRHQHG